MLEEIETVPVLRELSEYDIDKASGGYYASSIVRCDKNEYSRLNVAGMITGCGILQVSGINNFENFEDFKEVMDKIVATYNRAGFVIATAGPSSVRNAIGIIEKYGFVELSRFNNWHDSCNGTRKHIQRVYGYTIERTYPKDNQRW